MGHNAGRRLGDPGGAADTRHRDCAHGRDHDGPLPSLQARARGQSGREPGPGSRAPRTGVRGRRRSLVARRHDPPGGTGPVPRGFRRAGGAQDRCARRGARAAALGAAERGTGGESAERGSRTGPAAAGARFRPRDLRPRDALGARRATARGAGRSTTSTGCSSRSPPTSSRSRPRRGFSTSSTKRGPRVTSPSRCGSAWSRPATRARPI